MFKITNASNGSLAVLDGLAPGASTTVSELNAMMVFLKNNGALKVTRVVEDQNPKPVKPPVSVPQSNPVSFSEPISPDEPTPSSRGRRRGQSSQPIGE